MLTILFLAITISMIVFQRYREGRWLNLISLLMVPYAIIVFFNNFFVYKLGFYKISDNVIAMLLMAFVAFFLGTLTFKYEPKPYAEDNNTTILQRYDLKKIKRFLYIVGILGVLQAFLFYKQGVFLSDIDDSEGLMGNGPIGHLLLASYSVLPIYILYWTYNKTIEGLIPILLILLVAFSSLIKYNVLGPVITIFIFISLYRKSLLKKASLGMILFVVLIFISNYALGFAISGSDVDPKFYLGHFWVYFAGSTIYDNNIFTTGIRVDYSIFYKLMTFFFALPNLFIKKLFGESLFPHEGQDFRDISDFGEDSNIVDLIGYLYPSKGDGMDIVLFLLVVFFTGVLFSFLYKKSLSSKSHFNTFIANFLTYYVFLAFYAPFFVLSAPWEIIIWALILPPLFYKRKLKTNQYGNKTV